MNLAIYLPLVWAIARAEPCPCPAQFQARVEPANNLSLSGKRGLAYNDAALANYFHSKSPSANWAYNWGWEVNGLSQDIEYVPMLWSDKTASDLEGNIQNLRARGLKYILSFNEPDWPQQANMTVDRAVTSHIKYLNQYSDLSIGSPAVTSHEAQPVTPAASSSTEAHPQSLQWLQEFLQLCDERGGCKVDFCAVHWYGKASEGDLLISFLQRAQNTCRGKPIWLTEFSATGSTADVSAFMKKVLPFLDKADFIQRYSWFMVATGSLLQSANSLSPIGTVYATVSP